MDETKKTPPVDETDDGPSPLRKSGNDAEPRNTSDEPHPTIDAEDAKYA